LPQVGETVMIWSRRSGRFLLDKVKEHDDGGFRTWAMPYFLWGLEEENHPHGWHRVSPCRSRLGECPGMTVGEIASALDQGKSDVEEAEAARTGAQPPPRTIRKYVLSSLYGEIGMGERERGSRILFMAGEFARTHKKVPLDAWRGLPEPMREAYRKEWDAACAALEEERLGIRSQKDGVHQEPVIGEMGDWPERGRLRQLIDRLAVALGNLHHDVLNSKWDIDDRMSEQLYAIQELLASADAERVAGEASSMEKDLADARTGGRRALIIEMIDKWENEPAQRFVRWLDERAGEVP